jgi:hypothetical protein
VAGQKPTDVAAWTTEAHGKHGNEDLLANFPSVSALSRPSRPILLYTMDSDKMTIKELKSILRKKDFLLQVERQT